MIKNMGIIVKKTLKIIIINLIFADFVYPTILDG